MNPFAPLPAGPFDLIYAAHRLAGERAGRAALETSDDENPAS